MDLKTLVISLCLLTPSGGQECQSGIAIKPIPEAACQVEIVAKEAHFLNESARLSPGSRLVYDATCVDPDPESVDQALNGTANRVIAKIKKETRS